MDSGVGTQFLVHFTSAYKAEFNATKSVLSVLTKPIMGPLLEVLECTLPLWNVCAETVEYISSAAMVAMETSCSGYQYSADDHVAILVYLQYDV